jgi:D-alanyl-lipoteichoic acid acyltransferase DltB (MBOAT superfamily)
VRVLAGRPAWLLVVIQAAIGLVVYRLCWRMRGADLLVALHTYGLFSFLFLRQISWAVAARRGQAGGIGSYLCYLVFYPGVTGPLGGPEVWSEFSRRNLAGRTSPDYGWGARKVVHGMLQVWAADRIPISAEIVFASPTTVLAWANSLLLFVQIALRGMGFWAMIDATASFYGFRLRPNFDGILRCRNPSELWRSWRGTLTYWLVCHVYAPLGANRRHQSLNILAAFAVSLVWHWGGVPFLSADFHVRHLAPITLWAVANALAVIGHVQMTRRHWTILPAATPRPLRHAIHVFLTLCLGTLSVTLPSVQLGAQEHLIPLLRRLIGVGA